jgi:hypothetical protein
MLFSRFSLWALPFFAAVTSFPSASADPLPGGWEEHRPGGRTLCARGEEFAFFVNPGRTDRLIIDFIGGGACWNAETCAEESATFTDSVDALRDTADQGLEGVYDRTNPDNPYRDWTHVVVPYCTGDVHWGDADVTYRRANGSEFMIHHRGAVNATAVLDWVAANLPAPERTLVTGCSAGSYGSIYWTPAVRALFPNTSLVQFGDAGVGVLTPDFQRNSFPLWNVTAHAPRGIPGLDPDDTDWGTLQLSDVYKLMAAHDPATRYSQFTTAEDLIQTIFYIRMGGRARDWTPRMYGLIDDIHATTSGFSSFVGAGDMHCGTVTNDFFSYETNGTYLKDWLGALMAGEAVPDVRTP